MSFNPAMSTKARKAKGKQIRDWHLRRRSRTDLSGLAEDINPQVRGWINYYGRFYPRHSGGVARRPLDLGLREPEALSTVQQYRYAIDRSVL